MSLDAILTDLHRYTEDVIIITLAEPLVGDGPEIVFVNEAFTRQTGYEPAEVLGKTPRLLQGPKTDRRTLARIRAGLEKWEPVRETVLNYRKDGTAFWVELSIVPVADDNGWYTHWVSVQRDVSQLRATNERLALTIAASGDGIWDWDIASDALFWSSRFKEIVGLRDENFVPHASMFFDRLSPEDQDRVSTALDAHFKKNVPFDISYKLRHEAGHFVDIAAKGQAAWNENGDPVRMVGTVSDITDLKRAVNDLNQAQVLSGMGHWSLGPDTQDFTASENFWSLLKVEDRSERDWNGFREALGHEAQSEFSSILATLTKAPRKYDFRLYNGSKPERHLRLSMTAHELGLGQRYIFGILEDRSNAVQREEAVITSERLSVAGRMAGGVAHDFNNILTAIGMGAEYLNGKIEDSVRAEVVDDILQAVRQGKGLTKTLLSFSRQAPLTPEIVPVEDIFSDVEKLASKLLIPTVTIAYEIEDAENQNVVADRHGLEAAILNLIVNARDACEGQGMIKVSASYDGELVQIAVEDNGTGIENEIKGRIFEPFFTTKPEGEGIGIGLASVKGFVEQSGGEISVFDVAPRGTRMVMKFRRAKTRRTAY